MELAIPLILAVLGSSVLTAVISGYFSKSKNKADALRILQSVWHSEIEILTSQIVVLRDQIKNGEKVTKDLRIKYDQLVVENVRLREDMEKLAKDNYAMECEISKLKGI